MAGLSLLLLIFAASTARPHWGVNARNLELTSRIKTQVQVAEAFKAHPAVEQSAQTADKVHVLDDNEIAEAVNFLYKHMPPMDRGKLNAKFIHTHAELALKARYAYPWAQAVPWDIFLNNVLPYASLDEPREEWRSMFHEHFMPLVKRAKTLNEAALTLNRAIWSIWGIVFQPSQTPEIMSPSEVIAAGYASCTGLSIFLVNACRAVGIPARVAGTPSWVAGPQPRAAAAAPYAHAPGKDRDAQHAHAHAAVQVSGADTASGLAAAASKAAGGGDDGPKPPPHDKFNNHDWVEVWDGGAWSFTGAAEWTPAGMNDTWFFPDPISRQLPGSYLHAVYASSYMPTNPQPVPDVHASSADGTAYDAVQMHAGIGSQAHVHLEEEVGGTKERESRMLAGRHPRPHDYFPLAWHEEYEGVPAVDVTQSYLDVGAAGAAGRKQQGGVDGLGTGNRRSRRRRLT